MLDKFFSVGCEASKEKISSLKDLKNIDLTALINEASTLIVKTTTWKHEFLCFYPDAFITADESEYNDKNT